MQPAGTVFSTLGTTIFDAMSRLAEQHKAVNLGQGFPEEPGPIEVREKAAEYLIHGNNQYPAMAGMPALRQAIAAHEKRNWGLERNWAEDVVVTSGATEALAACLLAWVKPGDEVIVFEPMYDAYVPLIKSAGGVPIAVRLEAPDWQLDKAALRKALSPKTKALLLNDPLNPAAKVYTREELAVIADICQEADLIAIVDAVYERLTFDGRKHLPLASLPGMMERTLKIGSAGKLFSLTGWKVGWVTGPAEILRPVIRAHQFITFTTPPNLQAAVAYGLDEWDGWIANLATTLQARRDYLAAGLKRAGMHVLPAQATYFVNISIADTDWRGRDAEYCRHLTEHRRVTAIPLSAFYMNQADASTVRFCFAKSTKMLDEAIARLTA